MAIILMVCQRPTFTPTLANLTDFEPVQPPQLRTSTCHANNQNLLQLYPPASPKFQGNRRAFFGKQGPLMTVARLP